MNEHPAPHPRPDAPAVKVALLGCGVVGSQVARLLHEQADDLAARVGAPVELVGVAVRRLGLPRDVDLPDEVLQDPIWERSGRTERGRDACRVGMSRKWRDGSGDAP